MSSNTYSMRQVINTFFRFLFYSNVMSGIQDSWLNTSIYPLEGTTTLIMSQTINIFSQQNILIILHVCVTDLSNGFFLYRYLISEKVASEIYTLSELVTTCSTKTDRKQSSKCHITLPHLAI